MCERVKCEARVPNVHSTVTLVLSTVTRLAGFVSCFPHRVLTTLVACCVSRLAAPPFPHVNSQIISMSARKSGASVLFATAAFALVSSE